MKKFVLFLFALSLFFFGYSYALDVSCSYTFDWDNSEYVGDCSPSSIPGISGDYVGTISNFEFDLPSCDEEYWGDCSEYPDPSDLCFSLLITDQDGGGVGRGGTCGDLGGNFGIIDSPFEITIYEEEIEDGENLVFQPDIINKSIGDWNYYYVDSFSFDLSIPGYNSDPDDPDDPVVPDDPDVPVVPDDPVVPDNGDSSDINSSLGSVIVGLFVTFSEIIPYFVYLSIGILIVTLGFYAVRWLVNWLNKKINNTFK